jgi:hypothetical protein
LRFNTIDIRELAESSLNFSFPLSLPYTHSSRVSSKPLFIILPSLTVNGASSSIALSINV